MKMLKKFAAVMLVAAMSLSFTACGNSAANNDNPVIAKVGDINILKSDLEVSMLQADSYLQMYYGQDFKTNPQFIPTYNQMLDQNLDQLIGYEILTLKSKEDKNFKVTEEDVKTEYDKIKLNYPTEEDFNKALEQSGMSEKELKESIEKDLYYKHIIDQYRESVDVTDAEIEAYYKENIANYTTGAGANIYHILVDSEEKANEVLDKYNAGTSFADLAAEYGTDGTKDKGGALGYIPYNTQQYDQDFMAGAKTLKEGEVSKPVKTQFGWHLIKVDGVQDKDVVKPLDEVKDEIKSMIVDQKTNEMITTDVENWKKDYNIEIYADRYQLTVPETTAAPQAPADANATDKGATQENTDTTK